MKLLYQSTYSQHYPSFTPYGTCKENLLKNQDILHVSVVVISLGEFVLRKPQAGTGQYRGAFIHSFVFICHITHHYNKGVLLRKVKEVDSEENLKETRGLIKKQVSSEPKISKSI